MLEIKYGCVVRVLNVPIRRGVSGAFNEINPFSGTKDRSFLVEILLVQHKRPLPQKQEN